MKINWKVRFQNKVWLVSFIASVVALIYQVLGLAGVVPAISEQTVVSVAGMVINLLVMLGVVIDPTTDGTADSDRAMTYQEPGGGESKVD